MACWKLNSSGKFTCSSAWNQIREKRPQTWQGYLEHIFVNGNFAKLIWEHVGSSLGVDCNQPHLRDLVLKWWTKNGNNDVHSLTLQASPIFVCWNLLKNRCACKYGGAKSNVARVKYSIQKDMWLLLTTTYPHISWPLNWNELTNLAENCVHDVKVTMVTWKPPSNGIVKINTDGSCINNPDSMGARGICRNSHGELIFAFAYHPGEGTNNLAELEASYFGLHWCAQLGLDKVILEMDSQLSVH